MLVARLPPGPAHPETHAHRPPVPGRPTNGETYHAVIALNRIFSAMEPPS
jgi:hypothetical protein